MPAVMFANPELLRFAAAVLGDGEGTAATIADDVNVQVSQPVLARLLAQLERGLPAVLPRRTPGLDAWLIVGADRLALERAVTTASRFVVPSYAAFHPLGRLPQLLPFRPDAGPLHVLGAQLFPAGYYSWRSPAGYYDRILARLGLWLDLEARRPALARAPEPTYRHLNEAFEAALAAGNWAEAEHALGDLRRLNLVTAENLAFLRVQLLAQQQQWQALWDLPEYPTLAKLRMPRTVRAALLTAAHATQLVPLETTGNWEAAQTRFTQVRPRLGLLLVGRFGLTQGPVVQIFAYQAALDDDPVALDELVAANDSPAVQECISALRARMALPEAMVATDAAVVTAQATAPEMPAPPVSPEIVLRRALADGDYDRAIALAAPLPAAQQVPVLLQIAFWGDDARLAERAMVAFWDLPTDQQTQMRTGDERLTSMLMFAERIVAGSAPTLGTPVLAPIGDWSDWFAALAHTPTRPDLPAGLEALTARLDERQLMPTWAARLAEHLLPVVLNHTLVHTPLARRALHVLATVCLRDVEFPRETEGFGDLYECLYLAQLETAEPSQTSSLALLRLADARLRQAPARGDDVARHLAAWLRRPIPALETAVLEAMDLLAEYGVQGSLLAQWYRVWVEALLALPTARDSSHLQLWLAFGEWIRPGEDLLVQLRQSLAGAQAEAAPERWPVLPAGYRITIFTLRPSSAERAKSLLLKRQSDLDIRICAEKDMNPQVEALARHTDLPVIVTTAITHALTYGVNPLLKVKPVYPVSSGASSILQAVEERLRSLHGSSAPEQ